MGVDTHKDCHVAAVITALGVLLASKTFPTTRAGYQALVTWARGFGAVRRTGVECTGSYGAALARHLAAARNAHCRPGRPSAISSPPRFATIWTSLRN